MLVATFGADTAWSGRTITHDGARFVLEGFGAISAAQVLEYDCVTPLAWSAGGTRAWVRSVAHREGGGAGAPAAPAAAPASAPRPAEQAPRPAAPPQECRLARAHYVGGQPSLGPSLAGSLLVTTQAIAVHAEGAGPGPSVPLADVARVSLYAGHTPAPAGFAVSVAAGGGSAGASATEDRTFLIAHLRPRGHEAFALDGAAPDAVRDALAPLLEQAGVPLEGRAPAGRLSPLTDEVERLADLHARGALTDEEFRASLGPVFTGRAQAPVETRPAATPGTVPDAAKEAALDRLSQLRLSGVITDAELAAMRAKLLE